MIRRFLGKAWDLWRGAAAAGGLFLGLLGAILLATGTVPPVRWREAARMLAGGGPLPAPPLSAPGAAEWRRFEEAQRTGEEVLRKRRAELDRLEGRVSARLALLEAERRRAGEARRSAEEAEARLRQRQEALAAAEADAELRANLPFLSRMDGAAILALAGEWDDARLVRYLRAMRPSKAAEILEALRLDPRSAGRVGRVMEELKRPPSAGGAEERAR